MAMTLTVQNSISFVQPYIVQQPLLISNQEPALSIANLILETMLGAPFRWRFNRKNFNFVVNTAGGTDYVQALADLGFLESLWLTDATPQIYQLSGAVSLAKDSNQGRPTRISDQYDDNSGNVTFRVDKIPDKVYTVFLDYQRKAQLLTSVAQSLGVFPDEFSYIFNLGFLCFSGMLVKDSRFPIWEQWFIARLLGAQDGLSDQERDIFLGNWMRKAQTVTRDQGAVNSGVAGRGR